jgi:hypothetical protein
MAVRTIQVAAGIVRQKGQVLLVQQQGPEDAFPTWGLQAAWYRKVSCFSRL